MLTMGEIAVRFTYHPPVGDQKDRCEQISKGAKAFATTLFTLCPESREKDLALTHLDEAVMQANASIARRE